MKLEDNEFTTQSFIEHLTKMFGSKINGETFNTNDIAQYLIKGYTPYRYGRIELTCKTQDGIRLITVVDKKKEDSKESTLDKIKSKLNTNKVNKDK